MSILGDIFGFGKKIVGGVSDFFGGGGNLTSGLVGGGFDIAATKLQNEANERMQGKAQTFSHDEAEIGRDWQSDMFEKSMDFNSAQSAEQYRRAKYLRSNQWQTTVKDMRRAGLNPMLAYSQGGAGTPSTSAASISGAGSAPVGRSSSYPVKGYGSALQSAAQMAKLNLEFQNMSANNKLLLAQANRTNADTLKLEQDTKTSAASAGQLYMSTNELKQKIRLMKSQIGEINQRNIESAERTSLHWAHKQLADAERQLASGKGSLIPVQKKLMEVELVYHRLGLPRALNEERAQHSEWMKKFSPYLPDLLKGAGSAAGFSRGLGK